MNADQVLTLPSGMQSGFSVQDLQSDVSFFDASSISQWWIPTPTATPLIVTPAPTVTNALTGNTSSNLLSSPMIIAAILAVLIFVIAAVLAVSRRKKHLKQSGVSNRKSRNQNVTSVPVISDSPKTTTTNTENVAPTSPNADAKQPKLTFCPSCGNQLLSPKGFCPFCGSDLSQWELNPEK